MTINYDFLRPRKAELLRERYEIYSSYPDAAIERQKDGVIYPVSGADSQEIETSDKTAVDLGDFNPHWGHFITDCLSTFWFLGEVEADAYVFRCAPGMEANVHPNIREALQLLGVWDKVKFLIVPTRYREVYVPKRGMMPREYILKESGRVYDKIIKEACRGISSDDTESKVILCRANSPKQSSTISGQMR